MGQADTDRMGNARKTSTRGLSSTELYARFPSLCWSEKTWVTALTADGSMMDRLADRFATLTPLPRPQRG